MSRKTLKTYYVVLGGHRGGERKVYQGCLQGSCQTVIPIELESKETRPSRRSLRLIGLVRDRIFCEFSHWRLSAKDSRCSFRQGCHRVIIAPLRRVIVGVRTIDPIRTRFFSRPTRRLIILSRTLQQLRQRNEINNSENDCGLLSPVPFPSSAGQ